MNIEEHQVKYECGCVYSFLCLVGTPNDTREITANLCKRHYKELEGFEKELRK